MSENGRQFAENTFSSGLLVVPDSTPSRDKSRTAEKQTGHQLKRIAWRATATWVWVKTLLFMFGGRDALQGIAPWITSRVVNFLSTVGFAPTKPEHFRTVLKAGRLLVITAFSPSQMAGFFFYLILFPVLTPFMVIISKLPGRSQGDTDQNPPSQQTRSTFRSTISVVTTALSGWFLVYGNTTGARQIALGCLLSGLLLLSFVYRSFGLARPFSPSEVDLFDSLKKLGAGTIQTLVKNLQENPPKTRHEADIRITLWGWTERLSCRWALMLRGPRGQKRISLLVFGDYIASFLLLGISAVLFWALCHQTYRFPQC